MCASQLILEYVPPNLCKTQYVEGKFFTVRVYLLPTAAEMMNISNKVSMTKEKVCCMKRLESY